MTFYNITGATPVIIPETFQDDTTIDFPTDTPVVPETNILPADTASAPNIKLNIQWSNNE